MTERERLLRRLAAYDFAIVEYNLYLDTHPNDTAVKHKFQESIEKSDALRQDFEQKYGPLTITEDSQNRIDWIKSPWPWDNSWEDEM